MNIAHLEPIRVRRIDAAGNEHARIGAEQVDLAVALDRLRDQLLNIGFASDIDAHAEATRLGRHSLRTCAVEVRRDHRARAFFMKSSGQRLADSVARLR